MNRPYDPPYPYADPFNVTFDSLSVSLSQLDSLLELSCRLRHRLLMLKNTYAFARFILFHLPRPTAARFLHARFIPSSPRLLSFLRSRILIRYSRIRSLQERFYQSSIAPFSLIEIDPTSQLNVPSLRLVDLYDYLDADFDQLLSELDLRDLPDEKQG